MRAGSVQKEARETVNGPTGVGVASVLRFRKSTGPRITELLDWAEIPASPSFSLPSTHSPDPIFRPGYLFAGSTDNFDCLIGRQPHWEVGLLFSDSSIVMVARFHGQSSGGPCPERGTKSILLVVDTVAT